MFEGYSEEARRAIVLACIEAGNSGYPMIEAEHLLLGLLREDIALVNRFLIPEASGASIRNQIKTRAAVRQRIPATRVNMSLTDESKRVLSFAAEEAELVGSTQIGIEHLLLGLLREEKCVAAKMLRERGANIEQIRHALAIVPHQPARRKERMLREINEN